MTKKKLVTWKGKLVKLPPSDQVILASDGNRWAETNGYYGRVFIRVCDVCGEPRAGGGGGLGKTYCRTHLEARRGDEKKSWKQYGLSIPERKLIAENITRGGWIRKNIPRQVEELLRKPGSSRTIETPSEDHAKDAMPYLRTEWDGYDYVPGRIPMPTPGGPLEKLIPTAPKQTTDEREQLNKYKAAFEKWMKPTVIPADAADLDEGAPTLPRNTVALGKDGQPLRYDRDRKPEDTRKYLKLEGRMQAADVERLTRWYRIPWIAFRTWLRWARRDLGYWIAGYNPEDDE